MKMFILIHTDVFEAQKNDPDGRVIGTRQMHLFFYICRNETWFTDDNNL